MKQEWERLERRTLSLRSEEPERKEALVSGT